MIGTRVPYNPNPYGRNAGDCTVRAIRKATGKPWGEVYAGLCLEGYFLGDMPSCNEVWGAYLYKHGFVRRLVPDRYPPYTVREFCLDHPRGTYILALSGHVVAVVDGKYYNTWESGDGIPLYYWERMD